jgi:hypothetical protein
MSQKKVLITVSSTLLVGWLVVTKSRACRVRDPVQDSKERELYRFPGHTHTHMWLFLFLCFRVPVVTAARRRSNIVVV